MKSMLKIVAALGLIAGIAAISHAGTPQEAFYSGQAPLSNTTIIGSTYSATSAVNISTTPAAVTCSGGSATFSGRNCFTKFFIQIPTTTVVSILDGGTTVQTILGSAIGTTGTNSLTLTEDHLGPMCHTAGNATTFNMVNTSGVALPQVFNFEGYTSCGGTSNKGPLY